MSDKRLTQAEMIELREYIDGLVRSAVSSRTEYWQEQVGTLFDSASVNLAQQDELGILRAALTYIAELGSDFTTPPQGYGTIVANEAIECARRVLDGGA